MWTKYKSNNLVLGINIRINFFYFRVYNKQARPGSHFLYYFRKIIFLRFSLLKTASENPTWDGWLDRGTSHQADLQDQMSPSLPALLQNDCNGSKAQTDHRLMAGLAVFTLHHSPKVQLSCFTPCPCTVSPSGKHCENGFCSHHRPAECFIHMKNLRNFLVLWTF